MALSVVCSCEPVRAPGVFSTAGLPQYEHARGSLEAMVAANGDRLQNHFCLVGYCDEDDNETAWVYWEEQNSLILWGPLSPDVGSEQAQNLVHARRLIDLSADVVQTREEVGTSTFLVTRSWVEGILAGCEHVGDRFRVRLLPRPRAPLEPPVTTNTRIGALERFR